MNDLAQQALSALARGRDAVRRRPAVALAVAGFVVSCVIVWSGSRIGPPRTVIPLTSWFGLISRIGHHDTYYWPGFLMLSAIAVLIGLWVLALRVHRHGTGEGVTEHTVWLLAACWAAPFVLGPPLLSNDVFTYAAQGLLARHGFDPYVNGPAHLGNIPAVAAIDPNWRSAPSPYGPLATVTEHLAVAISGGNPLGAVIVLRGLGVACAIAIALLAADLAGPRRVQALTMTALNPLVLLHVVSAAHFEGLMCALLLGALVAANQRKWVIALLLAGAAGAVKAPALLAVPAIIAVHAIGRGGWRAWRTAGRDIAVAAVSLGAYMLTVPDGLGWIHDLNTPALGNTPFAPASLLADGLRPLVDGASFDDAATAARITALLAAGIVCLYLIATADRRALNRTVGFMMLAIALLSPVVYPWYLIWAIVCLAPTARAARSEWLVLASALACVFGPPGFTSFITNVLSVIATAACLLLIAPRVWHRHREQVPVAAGVATAAVRDADGDPDTPPTDTADDTPVGSTVGSTVDDAPDDAAGADAVPSAPGASRLPVSAAARRAVHPARAPR